MAFERAASQSVLDQFPDQWHVIVQLYREDDDFRELCDHFAECVRVVAILRDTRPIDARRIEEYATLVDELEQEIRAAVTAAA